MDYFEIVFVVGMLIWPAAFTQLVRRQASLPSTAEQAEIAIKQRRLWLWTAIAVGVYVALRLGGGVPLVHFMWIACFPLWFLLAVPLLRAKDPGWRGVPQRSTRSAALIRRDLLPKPIAQAWVVLTIVWFGLTLAAVAGIVMGAPGAPLRWLIIFPLTAGGEVALFFWCCKRSLIEAEPSVAEETSEIRAAREHLRRIKLYGWLGAAAASVVVFTAPALILIWWGESALMPALIVGAGGGGLVGIGGGVFGTLADLRRVKLNRLCIEHTPPPRGRV
jgi:hypothetical protein